MTLYKLFVWEPRGQFGSYRLTLTTTNYDKVTERMAKLELSGQHYRLISRRVDSFEMLRAA